MFKAMDKYRLPAQILLGAIGISFVGFGLYGYETTRNNQYIVRVGDQVITRHDLDNHLQNSERQGGQAPSREQGFQTLLSRAYLLEGAKLLGLTVSDEQIKHMIVNTPDFHDANNKFDPAKFQEYLKQNHINEEIFMARQREDLTVLNMLTLLGNYPVADPQVRQLIDSQMAERTLRSAGLNPAAFATKVKTDEASLKKFYDANKKNYVLPQAVKFQYLVLSPKDLAEKQKLDADELKQAQAQAASQNQAKRRIAHILIAAPDAASKAKAKEQAEKIAAEAKKDPKKFGELAKQYSQDEGTADKGGDLGEFARNGMGEQSKAVEDAAFALEKGGVSGVVESSFGYHIVHVADIGEDGGDAARAAAEKSLKEKKAQQAFAKLREELSELAFAHPKELKAAADKLGLTVQVQEQWLTRANANELNIAPQVADALFSADVFEKKLNSEVVNVNGDAWVVRVSETRAETAQSFDKVKEQVKEDWLRSESVRLANEEGKKLLAQLQAGKSPEVAWSPVQTVNPAELRVQLPPQAYQALIQAVPRGDKPAYVLIERMGVPEIVQVQKIAAVNPDKQIAVLVRGSMAQLQTEARLQAFVASLSGKIKTQNGIERVSESE
ncbi:SurA N-terminal domain-containing protein [Conchiformibius kuhniae]|uniref:Periplasmic chaperone PpiD n=1 Tax=Conchiformibius kuhniae TaxID=211502 RepID=A0A8T9MWV2_9NEIS|nr:SurA N-terminal domain-containing protein [Conchiformibius kuhniae]